VSDDALVVGGGLAGLTAALRLAQGGCRVTLVAKGVGGLPLSPATLDVMGYAPERVERPREAAEAVARDRPGHPYARLAEGLHAALGWFREQVPELDYAGTLDENLLLPTAIGVAKPSALAPRSMAGGDLRAGGRLLIVGFDAFKDFHPRLVAENLARAELPGGAVEARSITIAASPRPGEADVSGLVFARAFDDPSFRREVAAEVRSRVAEGEAVGVPALLGLDRAAEAWSDLQEAIGAPVFEIPVPPPSPPGLRLQRALTRAVKRAGGRVVIGPAAVGGEADGDRLAGVVIDRSGRRSLHRAGAVVLATGGFASGGLEVDSHGAVRETVLGLPVAGVPEPGARLTGRYLEPQPLLSAGLRVDERMRPLGSGGTPAHANLHAAGEILAGAAPWLEASGEGLAIAGGVAAASAILGAR
jgi:glycerol-3-phosphate dehydrogenase subunit B